MGSAKEDLKNLLPFILIAILLISILVKLKIDYNYVQHFKCIKIDNLKNIKLLITDKYTPTPNQKRSHRFFECKILGNYANPVTEGSQYLNKEKKIYYSIYVIKEAHLIEVGDYILTDTGKYLKIYDKKKKFRFKIKYEEAYIP